MILSFLLTYVMTYSMLNSSSDFTFNLNLFYQALFMSFAMGTIETAMMLPKHSSPFYKGLFLLLLLGSFWTLVWIRYQIGMDQREFLEAMIPHHSMAIEMVKQVEPRTNIMHSQQEEIQLMKNMLNSLYLSE